MDTPVADRQSRRLQAPDTARAITSCWISLAPSKIVLLSVRSFLGVTSCWYRPSGTHHWRQQDTYKIPSVFNPLRWSRAVLAAPTQELHEPAVRCGTCLRIGARRRILVRPRASALGSGPGCQPFGWGAGFCAFQTSMIRSTLGAMISDQRGPAPTAQATPSAIQSSGSSFPRRCSNTRWGSRWRTRWMVRSSSRSS